MQETNSVVESWLTGSDSCDGLSNPAGPLYIQGTEAMEAMADPSMAVTLAACNTINGGTSCTFNGGCSCC